ncbi:MAG: hypothetical protein AAFQ43_10550, partial [Bacteroidota bacterium]
QHRRPGCARPGGRRDRAVSLRPLAPEATQQAARAKEARAADRLTPGSRPGQALASGGIGR